MGDGLGGFLKEVGDAARWIPIVGTYVNLAEGEQDPEHSHTSQFVEKNFLQPGAVPLEKLMQGMNWTYDNGISQPITTYLLATTNSDNSISDLVKSSTWSNAWHVANHVSPGQAFWATGGEVRDIMKDQPLYATPAASMLPAGWDKLSEDEQQDLLKQAGMPVIGNRAVERIKRDSAFFRFASGATDFAARWWLDPTILAGKTLGAAKEKYITQPRPKGGWSGQDINQIMASSNMGKAQDFLWANKDNPNVVNNLAMFKKSALGPRAGGIISTLKSPEEVGLFLRTSLGDVEARARLESENLVAANRLQKDTARLSELDLALPRVIAQGNPTAKLMVEKRAGELNQQINADEALTSRYGAMLAHYGELDAVNLTRWSTERAQRAARGQAAFRTGPASTPLKVSRVYDDFYGTPLTVVRSFKESHPNGLIAIDDIHQEAVDELRGQLARIPGIGPDIRQGLLDDYLKTTTEGERLAQLDKIQNLGVSQVAKKHGFTADEAQALYAEYRNNITEGQEKLRRYSASVHPEIQGPKGEQIHVDEFMDSGGKLVVHPNTVTKLANDHVMVDLSALDKTLARNASALKALRTSAVGNPDWLVNSLDYTNQLWKFGTLFRLGYIPRVLGDDLGGQVARLGAAAMAMRTGWGVKNLATNLAMWRPESRYAAAEAAAREGVKYADEEIKLLQPQVNLQRTKVSVRTKVHQDAVRRSRDRLRYATNRLNALDPNATSAATLAAHQRLVTKHTAAVSRAEDALKTRLVGPRSRLEEMQDQLDELTAQRAAALADAEAAKATRLKGFRKETQLDRSVAVAPGVVIPPAFAGPRGEYYMKTIGSDDQLRTLFARNKQLVHSNLAKSYSHSGVAISYPQNEKLFVSSWHQAINNQIMQDALGLRAVKGASQEEMAQWLARTPEGRAHRRRLGVKYTTPNRLAASIWHEVDDYLPTPEIRDAALRGQADMDFLTEAAKQGKHPLHVHTTQLGESLAGSNHMSRGIDRVMDYWYKVAASLPADRMSRHPLFNQLYEGHAKALAAQEIKQGVKLAQADADRIATAAQRLALKDTRKLVFDIAHRSDVAHALRFISPFFAATTEAWQRWARIIADRPQVAGYAGMFFNSPAALGWMQDADGNKILRDGTVIDPVTGEKKAVPKSQRYIMARVPHFLASSPMGKALGMDSSGNWLISQDSMNLVTQGDPWFNPGTGPIVSIPVSLWVKDKPSQAELARHLGVLPFGPSPGGPGRTMYEMGAPGALRNFLTAFDTTDERYQRIKLQIMQKAAYEHANLGKPMPSAKDIANMTRNYWLFSAASAFSQPFATQKPDAYQMYRDQYNNLRRKNPLTADQEFLDRFGESYFIFAQATSKNLVGAEATKQAVELSKQYADLIAKNPELGALIIGPEGNGPFSPEAYAYQLSHPLVPGGSEMQRTKLSAEEAMNENQRRLGWSKFTQLQNALTAQLHAAGFNSFEDDGADEYKKLQAAVAHLYGDPLLPDGSPNPRYNEQWSKDFYTLDAKRYDRLIPGLTEVAFSPMAKNPSRSDLRSLQTYLEGRKALMAELVARKAAGGSVTLKAKANKDLASTWARFTDGLIEADTRFGDLYHRYLSRDMGVDVEEITAQNQEGA